MVDDALVELLRTAPLIDGHNDLLWALRDARLEAPEAPEPDVSSHVPAFMTDLPRLRAGGVGGQFWSVYVPSDLPGHEAVTRTLEQIDAFHRLLARYPDALVAARSADDVARAATTGRIASMVGVEGGQSIGCSLGALRMLARLGAAYMTLTHNDDLPWADSATGEHPHGGLTRFGEEVVREMNRLGMLVDLSHVHENTFYDAIAASNTPVIASHSCARALCDHVRNLKDDQLRALAKNGGVVGVNFYSGFLSQAFFDRKRKADVADDEERDRVRRKHKDDAAAMDRELKEISRKYERSEFEMTRPPLDLLIDHIDHIAKVAGIDHVGLGSDFDGVTALPEGVQDCSDLPNLTRRLLERGFSERDVRKILGENFLRVMEQSIDRVSAS
jgi:membrane dipeptidase